MNIGTDLFAKFRKKHVTVSRDSMQKIFTVPENEESTLSLIENEISKNLQEFLKNHLAAGDLSPNDLEKTFNSAVIPEEPVFVSEQADFLLSKVVAQSVNTGSPSFIGHMTSALPYFMLPLAKIMMALNQNLVKIETSKAFTPLERQVIAMLHRLVYRKSESYYATHTQHRNLSLGVLCSDGTISNITSLWVARNKMLGPEEGFAGINKEGIYRALKHYNLEGLAILVSKRGHYSLTKASDLLGIGKQGLVSVATDSSNKIDIDALKTEIAHLRESRIGIVSIVGVAGTTETGNVDPLERIADICQEVGCHFHVDAAWGGPTLFSDRYSHLLKGIERADSVCIDAHKQLYVPMGAGITLFRDETSLNAIEQHANYVIREGSRDLGKHTLEGSRQGMAMLVHSGLKIIGRRGYGMLIDEGIEKAKYFAALIKEQKDFELTTEPELNLLTYRFVPPAIKKAMHGAPASKLQLVNEQLNELTITIQKDQRDAGKTFVSRTTLELEAYNSQPTVVFRCALANPLTTPEILQQILIEQRELGMKLLEGSFGEALRKEVNALA